jgi:hypothetical protein
MPGIKPQDRSLYWAFAGRGIAALHHARLALLGEDCWQGRFRV